MARARRSKANTASPPVDEKVDANMLSELDPKEFGPLESPRYLYQQHLVPPTGDNVDEQVSYRVVITTYVLYLWLLAFGHLRDFFSKWFDPDFKLQHRGQDGYAPLLSDFDSFYTRRLKARLHDCFARPTVGVPGRITRVFPRRFKPGKFFEIDDDNELDRNDYIDCINLGSYNYLGFAQSVGECANEAADAIKSRGTVSGGSRFNSGTTDMHLDTERVVADFVGKEAAMIWSMGYGTNSVVFPALLDKKCLVLSDELNHASIRTGLRLSGAVLKIFSHNDMDVLESLIREHIAQGQPRSRRPWRKILVVVEGLYSMEGTMCNLPRLIELRRKYGVYLFMDEAHSIGAMGPRGRGICDYFDVSPSEVDILMGTFTKSFGSVGGYIAGSRELVDLLRVSNMGSVYAESTAPAALAQIQASLRTLTGELQPGEGAIRLQRLAFNSRYFRLGLRKMGFVVGGHIDSPVIPVMLFHPTKMGTVSRWLLKNKIAIVIVGYPATSLIESRIRFCMSAALTKSDLDFVLEKMDEVGDLLRLKNAVGQRPRHFKDVCETLVDEVHNPNLQ